MPIRLRISIPGMHRPLVASLMAAVMLVAAMATACISEDDLTLDQRHRQLSEQLMCPVCDGQTIDQSSAAISEDMKSVIWQQLEYGSSNAEIRDYFVERYGQAVLAAPTNTGINLTAWVLPAVIAAIGIAVVGTAYYRMRNPSVGLGTASPGVSAPSRESAPPVDDELEPYLKRVDVEYESRTQGPSGS